MNSGCGSPIELERSARDLLENEHGSQCRIGRSLGGVEWLRVAQLRTTRTAIGSKQWFCLFQGDAGPMGVSVESVAEVLETDTLVRLAWSPPQVVGLCSFHREVIPVVVLGPRASNVQDDLAGERDQAIATSSAGEKVGTARQARCVVLILKTEHGAWGVRVDSENTIMSWESPEYHAPRLTENGPVLIGTVEHAGTCYGIFDAEATCCGLRSAIGRWSGFISESNPSSSLPSGENPVPAGPGS